MAARQRTYRAAKSFMLRKKRTALAGFPLFGLVDTVRPPLKDAAVPKWLPER
jgi:hypothetical protein